MPRRKFIDKKNATTFQLLHRAQNDPLIHDTDASPFVFHEIQAPAAAKSVSYPSSSGASHASDVSSRRANATLNDLGSEFGDVRANEGEAAEYGIYYDDSAYDYMQHMRDLGGGDGTTVWVEAPGAQKRGKGKQKQNLEDAISEAADSRSLASGMSTASHAASDLFNPANLPSEFVKKTSYQDQQNIPDAIAGFQPDMDPRLREVLEALEDEEYVDETEDGDFFEDLTGAGVALDEDSWRDTLCDDDDDPGWESDDTVKPEHDYTTEPAAQAITAESDESADVALPAPDEAPADRDDTAWQAEFAKFRASGKVPSAAKAAKDAHLPEHLQSGSIMTGASSLLSGRTKKRKGALTGARTGTSGYSMSSSILARTEALSVLDARFERIEEEYADDGIPDDGVSLQSGMTGASGVSKMSGASGVSTMSSGVMRSDFDSLVDDFLGGHSMQGKSGRRVKRGKQQTGMEQLDEVRKGLGPARMGKPQQA